MTVALEPGMPVVCVEADDTNYFGIPELVVGNKYTIDWVGYPSPEAIENCAHHRQGPLVPDLLVVYLIEVTSRPARDVLTDKIVSIPISTIRQIFGDGAGGFGAFRFKPLHEDKVKEILSVALPKTIKERDHEKV